MPTNESDLHRGHRQRLKKRFLEEGMDNFEPHNILELLLFLEFQEETPIPGAPAS